MSADDSASNHIGKSRYSCWEVDVTNHESSAPCVEVRASDLAGNGVFALRDIKAGETLTEFVGMLSPLPSLRSDELALYQSFYGTDWRRYSQRYEIGLTGTNVVDAGGLARGGAVAAESGDHKAVCDPYEGLVECVKRAGEGDYVLLGKVAGATPAEGVAQLINDHSSIRARSKNVETQGDGTLRASDVEALILQDAKWPYPPIAIDGLALREGAASYIANIVPLTNCALVNARTGLGTGIPAPRVFAVATKSIPKGEELLLTYGVEWWLSMLRRAALAQLVTCTPSPHRAAALSAIIRAIEYVSCETCAAQEAACREAGCLPVDYLAPLESLPPLDELLAEDDWRRYILTEEFAMATECNVEGLYTDVFS